jgi:hypothetical protein
LGEITIRQAHGSINATISMRTAFLVGTGTLFNVTLGKFLFFTDFAETIANDHGRLFHRADWKANKVASMICDNYRQHFGFVDLPTDTT